MGKYWLKAVCMLGGMLALASIPARGEIVVGVVTSQTGAVSSLGIPYARGIAAGHAYIGEVGGEKLRYVLLDDTSDPSVASKAARKLIEEEKVDVLIGTAGAPGTAAIITVATEQHVPTIAYTPVKSVPKVDGVPWAISVPQPPSLMVGVVVEEMHRRGIKRVGFVGFSDAWGDLVYNNLKATGEPLGMTVVTNERYARADTTVTGQVLKVVAARPDGFLGGGSGTGGALPYIALAERGYKGPIFGTPAIINPDFVRLTGKAAEGLIASTGPITVVEQLPDGHPNKTIGLAFKDVHLKATGVPSTDGFSAYAFDSWLLLADAAKRALPKAKPRTQEFRAAMREAIYSTKEVVGTHGIYNYTPASHLGTDKRALVLVRLEHGKWKLLK
ncbi:MAG TPA: ABC transporter substrate-binding protein [Hyphomicrobiaceae bacterium]|nr:ABC transporter substrate-binding protein [Hyphomicrobiaceae bacterium]